MANNPIQQDLKGLRNKITEVLNLRPMGDLKPGYYLLPTPYLSDADLDSIIRLVQAEVARARVDELIKLNTSTNPNYTVGIHIEGRIETLSLGQLSGAPKTLAEYLKRRCV